MCSDVAKALHLLFLRRQIVKRVEGDVDERELLVQGKFSEVSLCDSEAIAARFRTQLRDHRRRGIDAVNVNTLRRQGQRDASRADAQLERFATVHQFRQKLDRRRVVIGVPIVVNARHAFAVSFVGVIGHCYTCSYLCNPWFQTLRFSSCRDITLELAGSSKQPGAKPPRKSCVRCWARSWTFNFPCGSYQL